MPITLCVIIKIYPIDNYCLIFNKIVSCAFRVYFLEDIMAKS